MKDLIIYCASSDERILKYDNIKDKNDLCLFALKGGTDSGQIIIFSDQKKKITLIINDLKDKYGNVLSKDCFEIYYEKYILVDKNWQKNGFKVGYYPDALISESIVKDENVTGDGNVGIFIDLHVEKEQFPGIYNGTFIISEFNKVIDVTVTICDATIDNKITHKSIFTLNGEHMIHYEGEASKEMVKAYNDMLLKHRVTSAIPASSSEEHYEDDVLELIKDGHSTFNIPSVPCPYKHEIYGNIPDYDDLYKRLIKIRNKSLESHTNLFKYSTYYDWMIDEPFYCSYPSGKVEYHISKFYETLHKFINDSKENVLFLTGFGKEILDSASKIDYIVTDYINRPNIMMKKLKDKDQPLFVYCLSGSRSSQAVRYFVNQGFTCVNDIGGISRYKGEIRR